MLSANSREDWANPAASDHGDTPARISPVPPTGAPPARAEGGRQGPVLVPYDGTASGGLRADGVTYDSTRRAAANAAGRRAWAWKRRRLLLQLCAKRALDIAMALVLALLTLPVMLLVALAIKIDSRGPLFFNRVRVGKDGRHFVMYKFRTMTANAEMRLADLQHLNHGGPYMIKITNDPRVTRVGRFLRACSLDELPQLLNVLKGEMSMVGPRPQTPSEVALYTPEQQIRLTVRPGITGLWQVRDRHNPSFEQWVAWDITYIKDWSLWLDLSIAARTAMLILVDSGKAVYQMLVTCFIRTP